jgi:hypothetical protein
VSRKKGKKEEKWEIFKKERREGKRRRHTERETVEARRAKERGRQRRGAINGVKDFNLQQLLGNRSPVGGKMFYASCRSIIKGLF